MQKPLEKRTGSIHQLVRLAVLPLSAFSAAVAGIAAAIRSQAPDRDVTALAVVVISSAFVVHLLFLVTLPLRQARARVTLGPLLGDAWLLSLVLLLTAIVVGGSEYAGSLPDALDLLVVEYGPGSAWGGAILIVIRSLSLRSTASDSANDSTFESAGSRS